MLAETVPMVRPLATGPVGGESFTTPPPDDDAASSSTAAAVSINTNVAVLGSTASGSRTSSINNRSSAAAEGGNKKNKTKRNPRESELLKTFGAIKVGDPFANQNHQKRLVNMEHGMMELLDVHTVDELRALCGALGILAVHDGGSGSNQYSNNNDDDGGLLPVDKLPSHRASKESVMVFLKDYGKGLVMDYIRVKGGFQERAYHEVLSVMWEGVMFEYLRSKGEFSIRTNSDPRKAVIRFWLEGSREYHAAFTPCYIERKTRLRDQLDLSRDLTDIIRPIEQNELLVKKVEGHLRLEHDFRNVLLYLSSVSALRAMERLARDYMKEEVLKLRSRRDHEEEEIRLIRQQQHELEQRHIAVCDLASRHMASEEDLCCTFMGMMSDTAASEACSKQLAITMLTEKLPRVIKFNDPQGGEQPPPEKEEQTPLPPRLERKPAEVLLEMCRQRYVKHMGRLANANRRMKEVTDRGVAELTEARDRIQAEANRADKAEWEAGEWKGKYQAMVELHAWETAVAEAEKDMYMAMAADAQTMGHVHEKRLQAARRLLLQMLYSEDRESVSRGGQLLEVLGLVAGPEEVQELCEHDRMKKEEVEQRQHAILAVVREAIANSKKKKGKGKGGGKKAGGGAKKPAKKK